VEHCWHDEDVLFSCNEAFVPVHNTLAWVHPFSLCNRKRTDVERKSDQSSFTVIVIIGRTLRTKPP
jgi:hypothetical protein